jgi:hypothetical protein
VPVTAGVAGAWANVVDAANANTMITFNIWKDCLGNTLKISSLLK